MAAAPCVDEAAVTIALPRSVCAELAKAFPNCPFDNEEEADPRDFQRMVVALLEESQQNRRKLAEVATQQQQVLTAAAAAVAAQQGTNAARCWRNAMGPEIHGGPEGAYEREASTGRWRSVSRTRRSNENKENDDPKLSSIKTTMHGLADSTGKRSESQTNLEELMTTARSNANRAREETEKLWEAASCVLKNKLEVLSELRRRDALNRARAEAELELQLKTRAWDIMRSGMDIKSFAEVARKVDGGSGDGAKGDRNLSIGAARRIFDAPLERRSDGSPRARRSRRGSMELLTHSNSSSFLMPASRSRGGAVGEAFSKASMGYNNSEAHAGSAKREGSSVRAIVQVFDSAKGGA